METNGKYHEEHVAMLEEVRDHLYNVAGEIREVVKEMRAINTTLKIMADPRDGYVALIAGKKQVPLVTHSVVTIALVLCLVMAILKLTNTELHYKDLHLEQRQAYADEVNKAR